MGLGWKGLKGPGTGSSCIREERLFHMSLWILSRSFSSSILLGVLRSPTLSRAVGFQRLLKSHPQPSPWKYSPFLASFLNFHSDF